ncbi:MAG: glycosyltransferase family 2 protein [Candidatus Omnitrophota bacterium]
MDVSLIIPVKDEKESLPFLVERLFAVMRATGKSFECLIVDDGSIDGSAAVAASLKKDYPEIRVIVLRRNFGQTAAMSAGIDQARGSVLVTLDADLQNDPDDIPMMLEKIAQGHDLVCGWRKDRRDPFLRRLFSDVANRLISRVTKIRLHDSGCTLRAYRSEVIKPVRLYGEMHRFIPALISVSGVNMAEVPVRHHPRLRGRSKYGFSRTLRVILDLITVKFFLSYHSSPSYIFGRVRLMSCFGGMLFFIAALLMKFFEARTLTGNPFFYLFIFLETTGMQLIMIGLLGEVNIRTYYESQQKSVYVIKDIL